MLTCTDPLPCRPRRILLAGTAGSGKTTVAQRIARVIAVPHVEIDALYHGPGWTPRTEFEDDVADFAARPGWVTEWQYSTVRGLLASRADTVVWLDLPRHRVMRQVVGRTVRRRLHREQLWNGNVEPPLWTFFTDSEHIVRWAWSTHRKSAERVTDLLAQRPALPVVRLASHDEAPRWIDGPLAVS